MKFYRMEHRGTLQQAIETRQEIDEDIFVNMLGMKDKKNIPIYQFYGYDERLKSYRFINTRMSEKEYINLPTWLLWER